jgi:hypothetical protein
MKSTEHHVRSHFPGAFWALATRAGAGAEQNELGHLRVLQRGLRLLRRGFGRRRLRSYGGRCRLRVGAAAKPASKLRRESALDVSGTVPPSGYRCDFGELSKIIEPAPLPNLLRLLTVPNSASLRQLRVIRVERSPTRRADHAHSIPESRRLPTILPSLSA